MRPVIETHLHMQGELGVTFEGGEKRLRHGDVLVCPNALTHLHFVYGMRGQDMMRSSLGTALQHPVTQILMRCPTAINRHGASCTGTLAGALARLKPSLVAPISSIRGSFSVRAVTLRLRGVEGNSSMPSSTLYETLSIWLL